VLESPTKCPAWRVSHFDFYRFNDPREWEDAGFREIFARPA
jgi:tRNA threonylcarbamoyladenosine biosynthesis protein TsaE